MKHTACQPHTLDNTKQEWNILLANHTRWITPNRNDTSCLLSSCQPHTLNNTKQKWNKLPVAILLTAQAGWHHTEMKHTACWLSSRQPNETHRGAQPRHKKCKVFTENMHIVMENTHSIHRKYPQQSHTEKKSIIFTENMCSGHRKHSQKISTFQPSQYEHCHRALPYCINPRELIRELISTWNTSHKHKNKDQSCPQ